MQDIFERYRELQQYVNWDEDDARRIRAVASTVQPHLTLLVEDFYEEIDRHPQTRQVITGGQEQIARLKGTLINWLSELFFAEYDAEYVARRWAIGWRHVEIGLSQVFTNMALARLRDGLVRILDEYWSGDRRELPKTIRSLGKLLDLDLAIIEDAYQTEYLKRQQRAERLAAIGQVSAGIAHELRNPLNVVKTSIYYLLNAKNPTPTKVAEHLERIERQVTVADGVITALSDFAKLSVPLLQPFSIGECLQEVVEVSALPENIQTALTIPSDLPPAMGDRRQLSIVFGNLIRNARDAMSTGGELQIAAAHVEGKIHVSVCDHGIGIPKEDLTKIHEPLFSTKARGIGLGLAITRAILEKHLAELEVESEPGVGSRFTVKISAAKLQD